MSAANERFRALVVDDEPIARKSLQVLLERDPEVELVGHCATGRAAIQMLQRTPVDVLLLDVQMPGAGGFEVLEVVGPEAALAVVFVTAFDDYAVQAFEVGAVHYLLKPYDDARFASVLARAKEHVRGVRVRRLARQLTEACTTGAPPISSPTPNAPLAPSYRERLAVKDAGKVTLLPVEQIDWVEAEDDYVEVHVGPRSHLIRGTLRELEVELDPRRFVRIHRSLMVNLDRVKELQPLFHGEYSVLLSGGQRLKLSRSYRDRLDLLLSGR